MERKAQERDSLQWHVCFSLETHLRVTKRHLPYGITTTDAGESALIQATQTGRLPVYLTRTDGKLS